MYTSAYLNEISERSLSPPLTCAVNPGKSNGLLVSILMTPLNAFGPYNAELAPTIISTFLRSNSDEPKKFPNEKFNPGDWLSTPSII